jgi:MFS family permease
VSVFYLALPDQSTNPSLSINISAALTMGLPEDLGLKGQQPNIALTILFVPYIVFEIPSNIMMKKLNPHVWLSICIFSFGIIVIAQAFVKNYSGIIATRFFLGVTEAGIFPGSFYLISFWYKHEEAQKRFTIYISSVILSSAFGGLLASAIANMDGVRNLANWRWLFILEGIATILVGCMAFFLVTDFPQEAKWLTEDEKKFVLAKTKSYEAEKFAFTSGDFISFFSDIKNYLGAIMYFCKYHPSV